MLWPCKIEEDGFASKKSDAERFAAAAACLKLRVRNLTVKRGRALLLFFYFSVVICPSPSFGAKEMGVIGPDNQLPKRRAGRVRGGLHTLISDKEDDAWTDNVHMSTAKADEQIKYPPPVEDPFNASEALSLFPQPKSLLTRVIQVATSSNRIRVGSSHPCH